MDSLEERSIIAVFDKLSIERKRVLLEKLVKSANMINYEPDFIDPVDKSLYCFARKQWPLISMEFFEHFKLVWRFLQKYSIAGRYIGCAEIGDVCLEAVECPPNYQNYKFENDEDKRHFFEFKAPEEAVWQEIHIAHYPNGNWEGFLVSELMELTILECDKKLQEYGYPSIIVFLNQFGLN